jgi:hypothetical protein
MNLLEQVKASLKWKRSNREAAAKLGISIEKYVELKRQLYSEAVKEVYGLPAEESNKIVEFKHDIDSGIAEIKAFSTTEPKTPEEIIELLKLDTTKWKLSSYWNKQRHDGWFVSAMVTGVKATPENFLENTIKNFNPEYQPIGAVHINDGFENDAVGVVSIQDLHFGKENNENIVDHFKEAIKSLVHRAYKSHKLDKIIYVIGGDLLNMDTFNGTTTNGTPVENFERAQDTYTKAFDALFWSVNYLKQFCENLHVVYLPGNHDRLSSYHMAHALSKCFSKEDFSIYFDVEYAERKVVVYGDNFFAFEHGDVSKKNTPLIYATEFPLSWGGTKYRTCYTGHFHSKKTVEYTTENEHNGFAIKHLPSLCSTDYWHYHNKYTGSKRQAIMEIHDKWKGKVSEFIYTV